MLHHVTWLLSSGSSPASPPAGMQLGVDVKWCWSNKPKRVSLSISMLHIKSLPQSRYQERKRGERERGKEGRRIRRRKEGNEGGGACVRVGEGHRSIKIKSFASYTGGFKHRSSRMKDRGSFYCTWKMTVPGECHTCYKQERKVF